MDFAVECSFKRSREQIHEFDPLHLNFHLNVDMPGKDVEECKKIRDFKGDDN